MYDMAKFGRRMVCHIPHAAKESLFSRYSKPWKDREIDILVAGVQSPEIYPERHRLSVAAKGGLLGSRTVHIRNHPGYRLKNHIEVRQQEEEYARTLGNSKFVICCSSIYKYGLSKYVEAVAAGACVLGDVPPEFAYTLDGCIIDTAGKPPAYIRGEMDEFEPEASPFRAVERAARYHSMAKYVDLTLANVRARL
jgi:hypothetical protein